jgi:hypothetical protein
LLLALAVGSLGCYSSRTDSVLAEARVPTTKRAVVRVQRDEDCINVSCSTGNTVVAQVYFGSAISMHASLGEANDISVFVGSNTVRIVRNRMLGHRFITVVDQDGDLKPEREIIFDTKNKQIRKYRFECLEVEESNENIRDVNGAESRTKDRWEGQLHKP